MPGSAGVTRVGSPRRNSLNGVGRPRFVTLWVTSKQRVREASAWYNLTCPSLWASTLVSRHTKGALAAGSNLKNVGIEVPRPPSRRKCPIRTLVGPHSAGGRVSDGPSSAPHHSRSTPKHCVWVSTQRRRRSSSRGERVGYHRSGDDRMWTPTSQYSCAFSNALRISSASVLPLFTNSPCQKSRASRSRRLGRFAPLRRPLTTSTTGTG